MAHIAPEELGVKHIQECDVSCVGRFPGCFRFGIYSGGIIANDAGLRSIWFIGLRPPSRRR